MDKLEATIKEALDGLEESGVQRELWPMVVAALSESRHVTLAGMSDIQLCLSQVIAACHAFFDAITVREQARLEWLQNQNSQELIDILNLRGKEAELAEKRLDAANRDLEAARGHVRH